MSTNTGAVDLSAIAGDRFDRDRELHTVASADSAPMKAGPRAPAPGSGVLFAYDGIGPLSVFGGASRRRYHFIARGVRLSVDPRDAPGLATDPRLRRLTA